MKYSDLFFFTASDESSDSVFYLRKEYEMKILDRIILLASLPEMLKLAGSVIDRVFRFLGIEIGDEL